MTAIHVHELCSCYQLICTSSITFASCRDINNVTVHLCEIVYDTRMFRCLSVVKSKVQSLAHKVQSLAHNLVCSLNAIMHHNLQEIAEQYRPVFMQAASKRLHAVLQLRAFNMCW